MNRHEDGQTHVSCCPQCGSEDVSYEVVTEPMPPAYGCADAGPIEFQVLRCNKCAMQFMDADAEDNRHAAICQRLGVFSPSEVRKVRENYKLTRSEFAEATKLGEATLGRWERGALVQNGANDNLLYLLTFPENLTRLRTRRARSNAERPVQLGEYTFRVLSINPSCIEREQQFSIVATQEVA